MADWPSSYRYPILFRWAKQASAAEPLVDGQLLPAHARTLLIGWKPPPRWQDWSGVANFDVTVDVRLRGEGLEYRRRFLLPQYRSVELPCAPYSNATVFVGGNASAGSVPDFSMLIIASAEPGHPARQEPVLWVQTYSSTTDEFVVPFGARRVMSPVADAGFTWKAFAAVTITSPLVANVWQEVAGTRFQLSVQPRTLIWELEL